ncbi:hypothetical protein FOZ63_031664 [Perkinsus olseni]|uniref:Integrase catalytic domain-containing protein n=1 Tax=Perkinsus olseni TaxID=32597 RepID=A0A7J6UI28_PEROL|nr:hypothetical protein FOZ63_031664 [Perkinsus olseni]
MLSRLRSLVWWPSLKKDVRAFVAQCFVCRRESLRILPLGGRQSHRIGERFSTLMIDFAGPFHGVTVDAPGGPWTSPSILLLLDPFSGWLELKLCKDQTSRSTIEGVLSWALRFGLPVRLHSDQGKAFVSELSVALWRAFGVVHTTGAGYHSEAQGAVENAVKYLKSGIRRLTAHVPINMVFEGLDWISRVHNTSPRYDEDVTPEMVVYGARTRDCLDALLGDLGEKSSPTVDPDFLRDLSDKVQTIHHRWKGVLAEKRAANLIGDAREDPVEAGDATFRVIVDGLHKRRVLGPYTVININDEGTMATVKKPEEKKGNEKSVPTWQLYKAPSLDVVRSYGDLNLPSAQGLRSTPPSAGKLVGFRTYGEHDTTYIDLGKVIDEDGDVLTIQRYFLDDKDRWHDKNADHERVEIEVKKADICITGDEVKLDKQGRATSGLRRLLTAAGVDS